MPLLTWIFIIQGLELSNFFNISVVLKILISEFQKQFMVSIVEPSNHFSRFAFIDQRHVYCSNLTLTHTLLLKILLKIQP